MPIIKISLIMPALDAETFIGKALDSVAAQAGDLKSIEVVVADGGSSDRTRQIAEHYSFVRVLDGADNGIYEGFNRGLAAAKGEIIGFLNADDLLANGALDIVRDSFKRSNSPDYISGGITLGAPLLPGTAKCHGGPMSVPGLLFGIPAINARFFKQSLMRKLDGFAPEAGLAADREILLRVLKSGARSSNTDRVLYHYQVHSGSMTIAGNDAARARVWQAELELADYLDSKEVLTMNEKKWTQRTRALVHLKRRYTAYRTLTNAAGDPNGSFLSPAWRHIAPTLIAWRYWRGRLSGY